jgi:hypothetical protein
MNLMLSILVRKLDEIALVSSNVIPWSCPVPVFGDLSRSKVATLGLNPSNREFVDDSGVELDATRRRFHTLHSLGLSRWSDVGAEDLHLIAETCRGYFSNNPYDGWFRKLDHIISGTTASYYDRAAQACHLDLVPYATTRKWTELGTRERSSLLADASDTLGLLLRDSSIEVLVGNGSAVVEHLQHLAGIRLEKQPMRDWTLPRISGRGVTGFAYQGSIGALCGVDLGREVLVLGFNHNIQSSFGVTSQVRDAIRKWVGRTAENVFS